MHLHCPNICHTLFCGIIPGPGVCNVCARVLLINETMSGQEAKYSLNKKRVTLCSFLDDLLGGQRLARTGQNGKESYIAGDCRAHDLKRLHKGELFMSAVRYIQICAKDFLITSFFKRRNTQYLVTCHLPSMFAVWLVRLVSAEA